MQKQEQCQKMRTQLMGVHGAITNLWDAIRYLKYGDSSTISNIKYAHSMKVYYNSGYFALSSLLDNLKADIAQKEIDDFDPIDYI